MLRDYGDWAGVVEVEMERNGGIQDIGWSKANRINTWRIQDDFFFLPEDLDKCWYHVKAEELWGFGVPCWGIRLGRWISRLLLWNKLLSNLVTFKNNNYLWSPIVSMGQAFGRGLIWGTGLGFLLKFQSSEDLTDAGRSAFKVFLITAENLVGSPCSSPQKLLHRASWVSSQHVAWHPPEEARYKLQGSSWLNLGSDTWSLLQYPNCHKLFNIGGDYTRAWDKIHALSLHVHWTPSAVNDRNKMCWFTDLENPVEYRWLDLGVQMMLSGLSVYSALLVASILTWMSSWTCQDGYSLTSFISLQCQFQLTRESFFPKELNKKFWAWCPFQLTNLNPGSHSDLMEMESRARHLKGLLIKSGRELLLCSADTGWLKSSVPLRDLSLVGD